MSAQTEALREVAEQLRSIATGLHPPALDDLGLAAALRFVAERARAESVGARIETQIVERDESGERPPTEVELAVLRIAQEALANAVRHSGASAIRLTAAVSPDQIRLEVIDDGVRIGRGTVRTAQAHGSMGLISMERRAQAIGARLERQAGRPRGTKIALRWPA